jgi:SP family general alpha glucoside:H+ symporter-like MFS transporter
MSILTILFFIRVGATGPVYGQVTCIIIFTFVYLGSIGPIGYALFAEISSSRLRSRTIDLGIVVQNVFGILMNIVVPLLINPDAANLRGESGFIFGGTSAWRWFGYM